MQNVDMRYIRFIFWRKYPPLSKRKPLAEEYIEAPSIGEEAKKKIAVG